MQPTTISSLQNPRVKAASLLHDARQRQRQGRIVIDGVRELSRAISAGVTLDEVFLCESLCHTPEAEQVIAAIEKCGAEVLSVTPRVFEKLAFGHRAEGVIGIAPTPRRTLADLKPLASDALVVVLEAVEKPGNIGAVLRTADAAGVSAMIVADPRTDLFNPNAIRASLGTIFTLPIATASTAEALAWLRTRQFRMLAARVEAPLVYHEASYLGPTAIVLGSETSGLSSAWQGEDCSGVRVPMRGVADSLNVSATAAVLFFEAQRQRTAAPL